MSNPISILSVKSAQLSKQKLLPKTKQANNYLPNKQKVKIDFSVCKTTRKFIHSSVNYPITIVLNVCKHIPRP